MTFCWLTDTHLDFAKRNAIWALGRRIRKTGADAVLITGDIATSSTLRSSVGMLRWNNGMPNLPLFFILGNHDFWGSGFAAVREDVARWANGTPNTYLDAPGQLGLVALDDDVFLLGVDGWYDGRLGNLDDSRIRMNDWWEIAELKWMVTQQLAAPIIRRAVFGQLATESAQFFEVRAGAAISVGAKHLLVLTHMPPFRGASLHNGAPADDESAPYYVNSTLGLTLLDLAAEHEGVQFTVLCGHTHSRATYRAAPNLVVHCGRAGYGKRLIAGMVSTGPEGITVTHRAA